MKPLQANELTDVRAYERERPAFRDQIIELKRRRRVAVGDLVTLVFENRTTVLFQVQEMIWAESIVSDERVQEELDTYNALLPKPNELSATLFIEVTDQARLREVLDQLIGIDRGETTFLVLGDEWIAGVYEGGRSKEAQISAVHYVTFSLTPRQVATFTEGTVPVSFAIEHPSYQARAVVPDEVRASLAEDLLA